MMMFYDNVRHAEKMPIEPVFNLAKLRTAIIDPGVV